VENRHHRLDGVAPSAIGSGVTRIPWNAWPNDFLQTVLNGSEPWSVRSFWRASTFGLVDPIFDLDLVYSAQQAPGLPAGWRTWNYGRGSRRRSRCRSERRCVDAHRN
jgi:hypothetical protein